jgi:CheY-like chemotaxis protein
VKPLTSSTRIRCPRCQRLHVRREGNAQSSLDWFVCLTCSHVWSSAARYRSEPGGIPAAGQHILVIDDEDAIVSIVAAYLREFRVSACNDVVDALDIIAREELDLLIVDFVMPKMSGDELVRRARAIRPMLPVLVITGYAAAVQTIGLQRVRILEKPFTRAELLEAIALAQAQEADVG